MKSPLVRVMVAISLLFGVGAASALTNATLAKVREGKIVNGVSVVCESTKEVPRCNAGTNVFSTQLVELSFECKAAKPEDASQLVGKESELAYTRKLEVPTACR